MVVKSDLVLLSLRIDWTNSLSLLLDPFGEEGCFGSSLGEILIVIPL